eukprot:TRINITY_DN18793_c0_g1_i1.p1 TRINITY_DN18793_c0_g1~~TRINITY_DN18793_c0_g1_i1.p1  ORF type:complete len:318 (+),score=34.64 TRINITY_DN18793_c0_g1_i1:166-1119(+)
MGLAAHILYLETTQYPPLVKKPIGVSYMRWARYMVDNFATVSEAVAGMEDVRMVGVKMVNDAFPDGAVMGLHIALEDASGDSAIIEFMDGEMQVYHGRSQNYSVLTNDPALPTQLQNLKHYAPWGGKARLPGDVTSMDRFVRMTYFLNYVPQSHDSTKMAGYLRSIIMESAVPQGAPDHESSGYAVSPTWYVSITDFKEMIYYWSWTLNPNVIWVDLNALKMEGHFDIGKPYALLNPRDGALAGDVGKLFSSRAPSTEKVLGTFSAELLGTIPLQGGSSLALLIAPTCALVVAGLAVSLLVLRSQRRASTESYRALL